MATQPHESHDDAPPIAKPSRFGHLIHPLRASLIGLLGDPMRLVLVLAINAAIVGGIVGTGAILRNRKPQEKPATLEAALKALDSGNAAEARRLADKIAANANIAMADWGGPDYIVGALTARLAEGQSGKERMESFKLASLYLERAQEHGWPAGREASGLYLLGKSLFQAGRLKAGSTALERALKISADHNFEIRTMLIEAWMGIQPPELAKALQESANVLAEAELPDADRQQALLQRAQILIRLDRTRECGETLDKVANDPSLRGEVALLRGRILLREGQALKPSADPQAKEKLHAALESFRKAQALDGTDRRLVRDPPPALHLSPRRLVAEGRFNPGFSRGVLRVDGGQFAHDRTSERRR